MSSNPEFYSAALDILANGFGEETVLSLQQVAPADLVPSELAAQFAVQSSPPTIKDVIIYHVVSGDAPDAEITNAVVFPSTPISPVRVETQIDDDLDLVGDWLLVVFDIVKVVLGIVGLTGDIDGKPIAESLKFEGKNLLEQGIDKLNDNSGSVSNFEKVKIIFNAFKSAYNFGMFQAILAALKDDMDTWDYIKDSVIAIAQIIAWFASDGVAAVAQFLLDLDSFVGNETALVTDVEAAVKAGSLSDAINAATALDSPTQLHTPATALMDENAYVVSFLSGNKTLLVQWMPYEQLDNASNSSAALLNDMNTDSTQNQTAQNITDGTTNAIVWPSFAAIPTVTSQGQQVTPNSAAATFVYNNDLYVFFTVEENRNIYYVYSADGVSWSDATPINSIDDCVCAPGIIECSGTYYCFYISHRENNINYVTSTDFVNWSGVKVIKDGVVTSSTTPGLIVQTFNSGQGVVVYYASSDFAENQSIWYSYKMPGEDWTDPEHVTTDANTSKTPAPFWVGDDINILYKGVVGDPSLYRLDNSRNTEAPFLGLSCADSPNILNNEYAFYSDTQYALQYVKVN